VYLIAGATGYVGGLLADELTARGREVRAMARTPERAEERFDGRCEIVRGDVLEPDSLGPALAGVDVAYYLVHSMGRGGDGDFVERDRLLLRSLASQLSIALENTRLYRQIDVLFRQYMSPDVATALLADPGQAALGGAMVDVTALFADLRGFTAFSERSSPQEIVVMLNRYFGVATPSVLGHGGTVVQFVGDALLALFNAPARQPDHPLRAARAALAMQRSIEEIAEGNPGWPRFRVGVNTGSALVGNIGSTEMRSFNAMGDAINVAARLQSIAEPGQVVIGAATLSGIEQAAEVQPLGELNVKGRQEPVSAYILTALHEAAADLPVPFREDTGGPGWR